MVSLSSQLAIGYQVATRSQFSRNTLWLFAVSGIERITAVVQTVLIARVLGITEYGVYGLLFGTIGLVASIVGLQMGLTATVMVARHRETEKEKAAHAISHVSKYAWIVSGLFVLATLPFADAISDLLLASSRHAFAVSMGCLFVGVTLLSGVQDGVIHGFEDFRSVASTRIIVAVLTAVAIYPAAIFYGLNGVMLVLLFGVLLKFVVLQPAIGRHRARHNFPSNGSGLPFREAIAGFSIPSMLVSLLVGGVTWVGMMLLSRQPSGFEEVAIVSTGLQWRGPILLMASSMGSVAIPVFSRYSHRRDGSAAELFQKKLLWLNGGLALGAAIIIALLSTPLLNLYGDGFSGSKLVFILIVASTVPQVLVNVYMQNYIGMGHMWRVLGMHLPLVMASIAGYVLLIPDYSAIGFAAVTFSTLMIFWFYLLITSGSTDSFNNK